MHPTLLMHFKRIHPMSQEETDAIDMTLTEKQFTKGSILLREGEFSTQVYFVINGIVRQYCLVDAQEKTLNFFADGQWVLSNSSMDTAQSSNHFLECSTDCLLVMGDSSKGEKLYNRYPNLGLIARKLMTSIYIEQQAKHESYLTDGPTDRYRKLLENRPDLIQRLPQYQIASYIGVTPESLSRIRKRIMDDY